AQALARSRAEMKLQLGLETTGGLGAGARPEIGARAAEESLDEIRLHLEGAHMVFIAAGMGGGTGTGAAPVIARAAQELGILTIAVVTKPFGFEGSHRMKLAEEGLARIRAHVDTMIVVPNQNLFRVANDRTTFADAFRMADDVLYNGVRGITDLIVMPGLINLDFADVGAIMTGMGTALMGMGEASGEGRALEAARRAIDNPLLDDVTIRGAKGVLINITGGYDMTLFELDEAANEIRREADPEANIIIGSAFDTELEGTIRVSVVAAGLDEAAKRLPAAQPAATSVRQPIAAPVEEAPAAPMAELQIEDMLDTVSEDAADDDDWISDSGRIALSVDEAEGGDKSIWKMFASTLQWIGTSVLGLAAIGGATAAYYKSTSDVELRDGTTDFNSLSIILAVAGMFLVCISVYLILKRLGGLKD
ncbi:MAG: cell division protein FtsZ, partial [Caulobacter vibrioides]